MIARILFCALLSLLVACGNDPTIAPTPLPHSLVDSWGTVSDVGGNPSLRIAVSLEVHAGGAQLMMPCGSGTLSGPLEPDEEGYFRVPGAFAVDNCGSLLDVTYEGWTDFEQLDLRVYDSGKNLLAGWSGLTRQVVAPVRCMKPCSSE